MSQVKFEQKENIRVTQTGGAGGMSGRGGILPAANVQLGKDDIKKDDVAHKIGDALTKGAGPDGYLAVSSRA